MNIAIILNYQNFSQSISCCRCLLQNGINYAVIVDNHSSNESFDMLRNEFSQSKRVVVVQAPENGGYAKGNNFGIATAKDNFGFSESNVLFIVNPDTFVTGKSVRAVSDYILNHEHIGAVSPRQQNSNYTAWHNLTPLRGIIFNCALMRKLFTTIGVREVKPYHIPKDHKSTALRVDVLSGAFFGIKQSVMDRVHGFDEGTFLYYEEEASPYRLRKNGYHNFLLLSQTYSHVGQGSTSESDIRLRKINEQSRLYVLSKYRHTGRFYRHIYLSTINIDSWLFGLKHRIVQRS